MQINVQRGIMEKENDRSIDEDRKYAKAEDEGANS